MPFTVSHAVIAFPLKRLFTRLPLDALILGATMPDLDYLINFRDDEKHWHTFDGLIVALPICLLMIVFWRKVIYPAILSLFPTLKGAVPDRLHISVVYTVIAALVGLSTHIVWDAFTHYDGWAVVRFPELLLRHAPIKPSYAWLQDLSSLLGLVFILYKLWRVWQKYRSRFNEVDRVRLKKIVYGISSICIAGGLLNGWIWREGLFSMILGHAAYGVVLSFVATAAIWSIVVFIGRRHDRNNSTAIT